MSSSDKPWPERVTDQSSSGVNSPESPGAGRAPIPNRLQPVAPLSERLQGIADALTTRAAQLLTHYTRERLTPLLMDELRLIAEKAVRGAALEGARSATKTYAELLPVPKGPPTLRRMTAITTHNRGIDRIPKLPDGI
jgi:hypothetical protein